MRSRIGKIATRAQIFPVNRGSTITVHYQEFDSLAETDRLTGEPIGKAYPMTMKVRGLVHFISPTTTNYRVHQELEIGDAILEFPANIDLGGKKHVWFEIDGKAYVQKEIGKDLTESFDAQIQDQRLFRTIVVTRRR